MPRRLPSFPIPPQVALAIIFAMRGFIVGSWVARIPAIADHLEVSRTELGSVLIAAAIGAMLSFQIAAPRISRIGTARSILIFGTSWLMVWPLVVRAPSPLVFSGFLLLCGFVNGVTDVSLNAQAVEIERRADRTILSSMHGMFSVGALAGTVVGGAFAALSIGIGFQFTAIPLMVAVIWVALIPNLVPDSESAALVTRPRRALFSIGPRPIWPLAAIGFFVCLVEEALADWGALHLTQDLGLNQGTAALGYTLFSCAMLVGRFGGDRVVSRFGPVLTIRLGAAIGVVSLIGGALAGNAFVFLTIFALTGLGFAATIPILYRAAGSVPGVDRATAVAGVATACYAAFLIGPPIMGLISDVFSLQVAFVLVGVAVLAVILLAPSVTRTSSAPEPASEVLPAVAT